MVEICSVFHGCGREKCKEVSTRVETLDLKQSNDIGNNWLGDVDWKLSIVEAESESMQRVIRELREVKSIIISQAILAKGRSFHWEVM